VSNRLPALLLLLLVAAVPADVEGLGESPVVGGNLVSARARALAAAQRDCVNRAVAGELGAERAQREASKLAPVLVRAERYLRSYRVLDEGEQGARFAVRLSCDLDGGRLRKALELALGSPLAATTSTSWQLRLVAGELDRTLEARVLQRVRQALLRAGLRLGPGPGTLELRVRSSAEQAVRGLGWPTQHASAELVISPAGISASAEGHAAARVEPEARRSAVEQAVDGALAVSLPLLGAGRFELRAGGLRGIAELLELQRALEEAGASARLHAVEGMSASFTVEAAGGAPELAVALRARGLGGRPVSQLAIRGGALWVTTSAP
jgi:hypothetical protein